jgi:hypothetical protein
VMICAICAIVFAPPITSSSTPNLRAMFSLRSLSVGWLGAAPFIEY